jgi:hypothetical protein
MATTVKKTTGQLWDVVVVGGGPAGMMAAATAALRGKTVLLLEKNPSLGKKLLITGGGRCNVTNNKTDIRQMLAQYGDVGRFLFSAFTQHSVHDTIGWFAARNVSFIEENEGRMFPSTESSQTIQSALVDELKKTGVIVRTRAVVKSLFKPLRESTFLIVLASGESVMAKSCVVATGGVSRPETGSTGEGFSWLTVLGHQVVPNNYALVPLLSRDTWIPDLSGVTLPKVKISLYADEKKQSVHTGKLLFTHVGLSGPTILNLSKTVGELLSHSSVTLKVNLLPDYDAGALKTALATLFRDQSNKLLKNALAELIPAALVQPLLALVQVVPQTPCHSVRTPERTKIAQLIAALPIHISGLQGADKAVVSGGGVSPTEINFKTMESRVVPGLYLVGDVLDINRPSGGYSLQLCWTTGFVAGENV